MRRRASASGAGAGAAVLLVVTAAAAPSFAATRPGAPASVDASIGAGIGAFISAAPPVLDVPAHAPAGAPLRVRVTGLVGPGTLLAAGSLGALSVPVRPASDGAAEVTLPSELTRASGLLTLSLRQDAGAAPPASAEVVLDPGPVVDPLVTVVGARSIVADGDTPAMAVTLPVDRWGNTVAEGTPVTFPHRRPDGTVDPLTTRVEHLLSWVEVVSGTDAGTGALWTLVGDRTGLETSLDEVPGPPARMALEPDPEGPAAGLADGHSLVALRTVPLADRFGNVELDGTAVQVHWRGPEGAGTASALTVAGVARLQIEAPSRPGRLVLRATSRGVRSPRLVLDFASAVDRVPTVARRIGDLLVVEAGPVLLTTGAAVPDGTPVTLTARVDDRDRTVTGRTRAGRVELRLVVARDAALGAVRVETLGASSAVVTP